MVSIIVPVYQAEKTIEKCIESILRQTYKNIELILVDDGSTDSSGNIIDKMSYKDKRIKPIHKKNEGVSAARNAGLSIATGKYIQFVDADDTIEPNMCEIMVGKAKQYSSDLVICGHKILKEGKLFKEVGIDETIESRDEMAKVFERLYLLQFFNPPWNKLYLKEKIQEGFIKKFALGEDCIFNLEYLYNCNKVVCIADPLYIYTIYGGGLTMRYNQSTLEAILYKNVLLQKYLKMLGKKYDEPFQREMIKNIKYLFRLLIIQFSKDYTYQINEIRNSAEVLNLYSKHFCEVKFPEFINLVKKKKYGRAYGQILLSVVPYRIYYKVRDILHSKRN